MSYLSSKKIYPGNWNEPLNGWYRNIDTNDSGSNDSSKGGPTSVLAIPGYRYFQQRGYVPVTNTSGDGPVVSGDVIVPSPYRNDDTRTDITGMVISGSSTLPALVYRATISVASGWGDGRVASGVYTHSGQVITFATGLVSNATSGESVAQANLASTVSGDQGAAGNIYFAAGTEAYSAVPFITGGTIANAQNAVYKLITGETTYKVLVRNGVTTTTGSPSASGWYISDADKAAGRTGYYVVEVCYLQPDNAPGYEDVDGYLTGRTVS